MLDLTKLKSARTIVDPAEIIKILSAVDRSGTPNAMRVDEEDGRAKVHKVNPISVVSTKADIPGAEELQTLAESVGLVWQKGYEDRVIPYFASDERPDRQGDIVRQNWSFDEFAKNPVTLWSHEWESPPIGNSIRWQVVQRNDPDYKGPALELLNLFATAEIFPWADTIFRLVFSGFLKSSSVGFFPGAVIRIDDDDERNEIGLGRFGVILDNNEMVEHSPASVPANTGAISLLRSAKSKGLLEPTDVEAIRELTREDVVRGAGDALTWRTLDARWRALWKGVYPEYCTEAHPDLDVPIVPDSPASADPVATKLAEINRRLESIEGQKVELESLHQTADDMRSTLEELKSMQEQRALDDEQRPPKKDVKADEPSALSSIMMTLTDKADAVVAKIGEVGEEDKPAADDADELDKTGS